MHPAVHCFLRQRNLAWADRSGPDAGVVAQRAFAPGTVLFESPPIAYFTHADPTPCCLHCYSTNPGLHACSRCQAAVFCGPVCRRASSVHGATGFCAPPPSGGPSNLTLSPDTKMLGLVLGRLQAVWEAGLAAKVPAVLDALTDEAGWDDGLITEVERSVLVFLSLLSHVDKMTPSDLAALGDTAAKARQAVPACRFLTDPTFQRLASRLNRDPDTANGTGHSPSVDFPNRFLLQCLGRFTSNNFTLHDDQLFPLGDGTYPLGALLNHSCRPNCVVMYGPGGLMVVRALVPILPGEELTGTYVDNITPYAQRRTQLAYKYHFICGCIRCNRPAVSEGPSAGLRGTDAVGDWTAVDRILDAKRTDASLGNFQNQLAAACRAAEARRPVAGAAGSGLPLLLSATQPLLYHLAGLPDSGQYQALLSAFIEQLLPSTNSHAGTGSAQGLSPPFNLAYFKCAAQMQERLSQAGQWAAAAVCGRVTLVGYLLAYPPNHPLLTLHCFTVAKLLWNGDPGRAELDLARILMTVAVAGLRVTHPPGTPVGEDAAQLARFLQVAGGGLLV